MAALELRYDKLVALLTERAFSANWSLAPGKDEDSIPKSSSAFWTLGDRLEGAGNREPLDEFRRK